MFKTVSLLSVLFYCLSTGLFLPHSSAQEDMDDPFAELKEIEEALEDEMKWLQEEGNEFVTVATKTKVSVEEAPSIVTVITEEQIRNMGARNIIDVLRTVPGFDIVHFGIYPMHKLYVRGMGSTASEKLKVMIDGHSIQPFWGEPELHFDKLPVRNIRRIEIIRGPGSALYGTSAFLGVINIITWQGGETPSEIAVQGGSYDTVRPWAEFSYQKADLKAYLFAEHFETDGYDGTLESDMADSMPGFAAPSASRELTESMQHKTLHTNIGYKNFYFSGFFQEADSEVPIGAASILTDEDELDTWYAYGELGYKAPITDKGGLAVRTYYDYSVSDAVYEMFPEETTALHVGFPPDEGIHVGTFGRWSVTGIEISGDYRTGTGIDMVAGASYEHLRQFDLSASSNANNTGDILEVDGVEYPPYPFEYFPGGLTDISENGNWMEEEDRTITALYAQGTLDFKEILSLEKGVETLTATIGARFDDYDDVGSTFNPRLGVVYAPFEKLWFKLLYGTAFRAPNFMELYLQNSPLHGNPDLKPEEITTSEFLVGYRFSDIWSASITGFYVTAEDVIQVALSEAGYRYENVGEMESSGMEAEIQARFGKNRYAYLNLTWQNVEDTSNAQIISPGGQVYTQKDFNVGGIPEFYGNIGVNYGFTERIIANLSLNYAEERDRSEEKMWIEEMLTDIDARSPADERWLVNASFTFKDVLTRGLDFQVSGFNLMDEDYRDPGAFDIPCPGATYMGIISYSF